MLGALWVAVQVQRMLLPALLGASPILRDFGVTAGQAGLLAAIYFPVYGLMQIPSGLIADRGGQRRLLVGSCLFLGVAGVAFAVAPSLSTAVVARAVVGATSSLFWVPSLKLCLSLSQRYYGRSVGIMVAAGSVGGVAALLALPAVLQELPWRTVSLLAALPMFPLAAAMLLLPESPDDAARGASRGIDLGALWAAVRDVRFWRLAWPAMMWDGTWFGLLTWLPRYARDVLEIDPAASGIFAAAATAALIPGSYFFGWMASHRPASGRPLFYLAQIGSLIAALALPLVDPGVGIGIFLALVCVIGALFGGFFIYMSLLVRDIPTNRLGAATGLCNCLTFFPAFGASWLMGAALDLIDRPTTTDPIYSTAAYDAAWVVAAGWLVVGLLGAVALSRWPDRRRAAEVG